MSLFKLMKTLSNPQPLAKSDDGNTPRKEAAKATAEALTGDEYKFARKSKFKNKGEDIAHSARHKVNEWKGLQEAEASGNAEKMVKLDTMLKHDPPNLMPTDPKRAMTHLAAHYAISKFPKAPTAPKWMTPPDGDDKAVVHEYDRDGKLMALPASQPAPVGSTLKRTWTGKEIKQRARQMYVDAYKVAKQKAEELAHTAQSPAHVASGVRAAMYDTIMKHRDGASAYQRGVDASLSDMLLDYHNKTLKWGHRPKTSVYGALSDFETNFRKKHGKSTYHVPTQGDEAARAQEGADHENLVAQHVGDLIAGKSASKTFGLDPKEVRRFDPVEAYVSHAERNGPDFGWQTPEHHDDYLMNTAKMRALQYGNSVTDSEREHHLKHTAHALRDLTETLGLPHEMASYNGRLGLAVGARGHGKALAHYEPSLRTINLTRKSGVGSLAHEWGHFFDNLLPHTMYGHGHGSYGSEAFPLNRHLSRNLPEHEQEEAENVRTAMEKLSNGLDEFKHRIRRDWQKNPTWAQGMSVDRLHNYWLTGRELFARAFEKHLDRKMREQGRHNTYLSGVKPHPLWPSDEEAAKLSPLFDELFRHFRHSGYLKKSIDRIKGGLADKKKPGDFDPKALEQGIKVEMEHTNDREIAREIAMDHLTEDPKYYQKLAVMEKSDVNQLRESMTKNTPKEVASIAVIDGDRLLMGKRNDNQRWTLPGGHMNTGESPAEGAARELAEETGISAKPEHLTHLGTEEVTTFTGKRMIIHSFALFGHFRTDSERDPDQEVQTWKWIDVSRGVPDTVMGMLHSPKNTTLKLLGLQDDE